MNSVKLTGRFVGKPKLAPTDAGRPVCDMRIAVDNGRYCSFDIDVSVFDASAHTSVEQLSKGDEVWVEGELRFRTWRDRGGRLHERFSILGEVEPAVHAAAAKRPNSEAIGATEPEPTAG